MPSKTHGCSRSKCKDTQVVYRAWRHMKERCLNKKHKQYGHYGGRGITVCRRWLEFSNFMADMGFRPSDKYSLDRMDNNKGYTPKNCRWATYSEQNLNKRKLPRKAYRVGPHKAAIKRLHGRGWSTRRIARHLGIGKTAVWQVLKNG